MPRMTGAKFMVEMMKAYGVTHAFYMPMVVTRALVEMEKAGIRRIMTHGEKAAAYMADGYARAAHRAGVCMAQNVGAANLAAGLQDAYLAGSPVIAMTGRGTPMQQYRHHYQEIDHIQPFAAVTKYNVIVDSAAQLPLLLRQAFRSATSGAPGPVHLDLQGTTGNVIMDAEADLDVVVEAPFTHVPPFRSEPEMAMVQEALRLLADASRPVIVAGGGVASSQAQREVVELAERLSIPVATSLNAKGTIPDHHPLSVGVCGTYSRWCANRVVAEADLVFFIGSHTGSQVTTEWQIPRPGTPVIQLDIDPAELGRSYPIQAGLQGDAKAAPAQDDRGGGTERTTGRVARPRAGAGARLARGGGAIGPLRYLTHPPGAPVHGAHRVAAQRCGAGDRYGPFRYLDRHHGGCQGPQPAVPPLCRAPSVGRSPPRWG